MHGQATQISKNGDYYDNIEAARAQALAKAIQAVNMAVLRKPAVKLFNKEIACSKLAAD